MRRRTFLGAALAAASAPPLFAALRGGRWDDAAEVLRRATESGQVAAAVMHVAQRGEPFTRHFGKAASADAMFLLGSVSKPINVTALMTLFDRGKFRLEDRVKKFLPAFTGGGPEALALSEKMQDAWLAFARTGDPSTPALGTWPPYEPEQRSTMRLGAETVVEDAPLEQERAFWS